MRPAWSISVRSHDRPGVLHSADRGYLRHNANISYVDITDRADDEATTYFELEGVADLEALLGDLSGLDIVISAEEIPSFWKIFGKRIIVVGGGAQVGQVVVGAVSEADRHNIRGERISVDTIPLVGEKEIAGAVRAVGRLPRAKALVLAGSLMGGEISRAVREIRAKGIVVVSLNMAGSVPREADLVVSDPVQAGVMTVMHVASTARFDIHRQQGKRY